MGRPPLPVGTAGKIGFTTQSSGQVRARALVRDPDGVVREVARNGTSKAAAERRLKEALRDRRGPTGEGEITAESTFQQVAEVWLTDVADAELAETTVETYRRNLDLHALPALGGLRMRELTVGTVDRFLKEIRQRNGPGAAKNTKKVVSLVLGLAVRHDALDTNPVRDVAKVKRSSRGKARALTVAETSDLLKRLSAEVGRDTDTARPTDERDLVDICEWMLGSGVRIGEALAVRRDVVDLESGVVEINATVVRVTGRGVVLQERAKTDAGWRVIAIPNHAVELFRRRMSTTAPVVPSEKAWVLSPAGDYRQVPAHSLGLIFTTEVGAIRNPTNVQRGLRVVLKRIGDYRWVKPHNFRKTVATRLDEAGLTAREVADHLGHANPSMTQDVYMGRGVAAAEAATALAR